MVVILYGIPYRNWICIYKLIYIYKYSERERQVDGLDDRGSVSDRAVMSIIYAVACGTAVGSTFPGALTLWWGRLGVGLAARLRLVPGLGVRGAVPPLSASSWRVV
jgi:hypothetical protein